MSTSPDRSDDRSIYNRAVLILLALILVVFALHNIVSYDIWWQLKTGELVRRSGWPDIDPFSYGFPGGIWIEIRWLYCVAISYIFEYLGLNFLIIAKILWLLVTGAILWAIGKGGSRWAVNLGLLCALVLMHQRLVIRPELVTFAFLAITLLCLRRFQGEKKLHWLYPLPLLQILWVNSHTLYVLGPVVIWLFVGSELLSSRLPWPALRDSPDRIENRNLMWLALTAVAATAACVVNPYGVHGALFAVELFTQIQSNHILAGIITEFRSPFNNAGWTLLFVGYISVIAISAAGFILNRRSISAAWLLLWAAFLYLSFLAERNVPLFGIVAGVTVMLNYGSLRVSHKRVRAVQAACAVFAVVMVPLVISNYYYRSLDPDRRFGFGVAERRFPIRAMAFVDAENLPRPVLTNLGESAYTMFRGGPKSVYIDGRLEVYDGEKVAQAMRLFGTGENIDQVAREFGIFTVIVHHENEGPLVQTLLKNSSWAPVYFDDSHLVFLRMGPETQPWVDRLRVNWQDPQQATVAVDRKLLPSNWLAGVFPSVAEAPASRALGNLLITLNPQKAQHYLEDAVRQWPDDPRACLQLGVLYRAQKRESEAAALLARVPQRMWQERNAQIFAAMTYEAFNNMNAATDAWLEVTKLGERSTATYERLARSAIATQRWIDAYPALSELAKANPNDVQNWNNLGIVADKLKRTQDSLQAFDRSLQLSPGQPQVLTQIGVIKRETGDVAGARQAFERALEVDPSFESARQHIERMSTP